MSNMWNKFVTINTPFMKLMRTIFQGVIGVIIAYVDVLVGSVGFIPDELRPVIVALIMAILSPLMAASGKEDNGEG